ncbi:MAG TPA: 50S ribosomal protein L25 [Firmicutes bacterium]|nr:50S ribosomal protein L25 [Bacillota bacterium]
MANYQLTVEKRTGTGKAYARQLRATGKIPAIVYGSGQEAVKLMVDTREAARAVAAVGSLINLDVEGESKTVLIKEIHSDPVRGDLLHLDFHEIDLTKTLEITVPIRVVGEENRPSDGGVVTTLLWEVEVSCLPTDIPEFIEVDVSELELDNVINVDELILPAGVEILEEPDEAVVKVDIPSLELEEEVAEEEELADEELAEEEPAEGEEAEETDEEEATEE